MAIRDGRRTDTDRQQLVEALRSNLNTWEREEWLPEYENDQDEA